MGKEIGSSSNSVLYLEEINLLRKEGFFFSFFVQGGRHRPTIAQGNGEGKKQGVYRFDQRHFYPNSPGEATKQVPENTSSPLLSSFW